MPDSARALDGSRSRVGNRSRMAACFEAAWPTLKAETIDYGVMENAERVVVLPAGGLGWSDVGSWDTLFEVLLPDMRGNVSASVPASGGGDPQHPGLRAQR